jgi:hypothetical protein
MESYGQNHRIVLAITAGERASLRGWRWHARSIRDTKVHDGATIKTGLFCLASPGATPADLPRDWSAADSPAQLREIANACSMPLSLVSIGSRSTVGAE